MEIKRKKHTATLFLNLSTQELKDRVENGKELEFTGFSFTEQNKKFFIYKDEKGNYCLIDEKNVKQLMNIVNAHNRILNNRQVTSNTSFRVIHNTNINNLSDFGHVDMSLRDLMKLYKMYGNKLNLEDYFLTNGIKTYDIKVFLNLVKEVVELERDIKEKKLTSGYAIMKYIYDKYKMECDYWNPLENYGVINTYRDIIPYDENRVVSHPSDVIGLVCEKYATCEGMATGLVQLFDYFDIDASLIRSNTHGMIKVEVVDKGERRVSYIDLSREISPNWKDTRYNYFNRVPSKMPRSGSSAKKDSYDYFLKRNINIVGDNEENIAVDFRPSIIILDNSNYKSNNQQNNGIEIQSLHHRR